MIPDDQREVLHAYKVLVVDEGYERRDLLVGPDGIQAVRNGLTALSRHEPALRKGRASVSKNDGKNNNEISRATLVHQR